MYRRRSLTVIAAALLLVTLTMLPACVSSKVQPIAQKQKIDAVVPILREYEQQHPQDTVVVEQAITSFPSNVPHSVAEERAFKNQVTPFLQMFGTENPDRKQRIDDLLTAWEIRLKELETP